MRLQRPASLGLLGLCASLFAPLAVQAADASPAATRITINATRVTGAEAIDVWGKAPAGAPLEAVLSVRYSRDLPTVLLSRRPVPADANGNYNVTLSIAPAYFRNAIVTVVIRTLPAGASAAASVPVGPPNESAPPDDIPPSVR